MRRNTPLPQLVYNHLFPCPRPTDPTSFSSHVTRNIVPEVRLETTTFYGTLDSTEARYPGLSYSHGPHRMRLRRFPWHRRLFRAFDELGLTDSEIASLCRWEGTKWARERYEKEEGVVVRDTTGEEIKPWVRPPTPDPAETSDAPRRTRPSAVSAMDAYFQMHRPEEFRRMQRPTFNASQEPAHAAPYLSFTSPLFISTPNAANNTVSIHRTEPVTQPESMLTEDEEDEDDDDDEGELESVGVELNRRLIAAATARERGADVVVMDEAWEQWLKDAAERGVLGDLSSDLRVGQAFPALRTTVTTTHEPAAPTVRSTGLGS